MPKYAVEFTSENPYCPNQIEVEADNPMEAVKEAMRRYTIDESCIEEYPDDHPLRTHYAGWKRFVVSVSPPIKDIERETYADVGPLTP
jgi:hypothetical protein